MDSDFLTFISDYDLIFLDETWISDKDKLILIFTVFLVNIYMEIRLEIRLEGDAVVVFHSTTDMN